MAQQLKRIKKSLNCLAALNARMQMSHGYLSAATHDAFARRIINYAQRDALCRVESRANKAKHVGLGYHVAEEIEWYVYTNNGFERFTATADCPPLLAGAEFEYTYGSSTYAVKIFAHTTYTTTTTTTSTTTRFWWTLPDGRSQRWPRLGAFCGKA